MYETFVRIAVFEITLSCRFESAVHWEHQYAVDEQMVKFTGKTAPEGCRTYMPMKPISHGLKMWARCGVSGYTYKVELYTGKQATGSQARTRGAQPIQTATPHATYTADVAKAVGKSGEVVLRLCEGLPQNSRIFFDNYFSSVALLKHLREQQIWAVSTVRANRIGHCPMESEKEFEKHSRGHWDFKKHRDGVEVVGWNDNKRVLLASNYVGVEPHDNCLRWDADEKKKVAVTRPAIVKTYNSHMGGVDLADQLVAVCPIPLKSKKWYRRVVARIFDLLVVNAWILYRKFKTADMPLYDFKFELASSLLNGATPRYGENDAVPAQGHADAGQQNDELEEFANAIANQEPAMKTVRTYIEKVPEATRFDRADHLPGFSEKSSRCRNVIKNGNRSVACAKKTETKCTKCGVALCLMKNRNCFVDYHTQQ